MEDRQLRVTLRNGSLAPAEKAPITERLIKLSEGLNMEFVNIDEIVNKVFAGIYDKIKTTELDNLAAETAAYLNIVHPDYSLLAARIAVTNLHKETNDSFFDTIDALHNYTDPRTNKRASLISEEVYEIVKDNRAYLEEVINYERDYNYDFFGFKTLEKSYLLKLNGRIAERPQHMLMRVSLGIHGTDLKNAVKTYNLMSESYFTHATPTLFNSGTPCPQMSSCFLLTMKDDSLVGIFDTLSQCASISKCAGGIGLSISDIRAADSYIKGTNGYSRGVVPMIKVFNDTARYVDQGGGRRKGAFALYIEPWHADIYDFLNLKKNTGKEEQRARDLFYALWTNDLFMQRVKSDKEWTLFCPNECPGLTECYGEKFKELYESYESAGKGRRTVKAQHLWASIIESQTETGTPYMLYKDACNEKSNQKNLGTIKSSNLCTEIVEYTSADEVAVCNLASISLSKFVDEKTRLFDFDKLGEVTAQVTRNLNKIIDRNFYPVPEAKKSNLRHRPIGIGIQGYANALCMMRLPYESDEAVKLNKNIFETIYYYAVKTSVELAREEGPYETFAGSPASEGKLQFDLWNVAVGNELYDWDSLKEEVKKVGMRNSLLLAPMPTASTSQILGNNESFEPFTSNLYVRRVLAGEFICMNKHLVKDLIELVNV